MWRLTEPIINAIYLVPMATSQVKHIAVSALSATEMLEFRVIHMLPIRKIAQVLGAAFRCQARTGPSHADSK